jgi:hypothetical protein
MSNRQFIRFSLAISPEQYLHVYQGNARNISVLADDGRRIEFSTQNVQGFLTREGIHGHFEMELSASNRFISIRKLPP